MSNDISRLTFWMQKKKMKIFAIFLYNSETGGDVNVFLSFHCPLEYETFYLFNQICISYYVIISYMDQTGYF